VADDAVSIGPWSSTIDGESVDVSGDVVDPETGQLAPAVTVILPHWRAAHLSDVLARWTRILEAVGDDSDGERELADALGSAAQTARALRDARNAG